MIFETHAHYDDDRFKDDRDVTIKPVSYTHLDVYKRQIHDIADGKRDFRF